MKILIAVPTFENIMPDTFKSIYGLDRGGHWLVFDFVRGYDCANARNMIAKQAIAEKADYVLMVDNDVVLPGDVLVNMLDDPKDVCLGYYAHRNFENEYEGKTSVCKLGEYNYTHQFTGAELQNMRSRGEYKVKIHGGGMGCALIKTDVFNRLKFPYYKWLNYNNGYVLSEDLYFCEECNQNGIDIWTDTRAECGHMFRHIQWCE